jgi:Cryptococcal mannosyltransferase 1
MFKFRRRRDGYQPLGRLNGFKHAPRRYLRFSLRLVTAALVVLTSLLVLTPVLIPSYTRRPSHYTGSNPRNETVFIAANIVNENLIRGPWGQSVRELIDIIGRDKVFLSIYENDSGPGTKAALRDLSEKVDCESSWPSSPAILVLR